MTSRIERAQWAEREKEFDRQEKLIAGNHTGRSSRPSGAERDAKNMTYDQHMKMWVPNIPKV